MSSGFFIGELPSALLTMMSIRPNSSIVVEISESPCSGLVISVTAGRACIFNLEISIACFSRESRLRLTRIMDAPARAYSMAISVSMPPDPPVTTATLSLRSKGEFMI